MKNEGIKIHVYRDGGGDIHAYTCVYIHSRDICLKGFSLFSRIYFLAETAFTTAIVSKDISLQF